MSLLKRKFGKADFEISILGFGAGNIGGDNLEESYIEKMLNELLDSGINFIDTARGYGQSEERIGKYISHRRSDYILSTKVGYGVPGFQDWTYDCVIAGVDYALNLLKTDYLDIVHLHSCPKDVLERGEVTEALLKTVEAGKVIISAYSGENSELEYAVNTGSFGSIQCSVNIADQRNIVGPVAKAKEKSMGVIAKRAVANAPWRFADRPHGDYCEEYWLRLKKMGIREFGSSTATAIQGLQLDIPWNELAIRFSAFTEGVTSCIIGTTNLNHVKENIEAVKKGPLPAEIYDAIRDAFRNNDDSWTGQI